MSLRWPCLRASGGAEPALLSRKCCSGGIAPCRFLPLLFPLRGRIATPSSFPPLQLELTHPSLLPQRRSRRPSSLYCWSRRLTVSDGGPFPCSYTLAPHLTLVVLYPSSVVQEGQPGQSVRAAEAGSRAAAALLVYPRQNNPEQRTVWGRKVRAGTISWFEHCVISAKLPCPYFYPMFFTQESHLEKELPFPRGMHSTERSEGF